ncbi:hypothetical protein KAR91_71675, partial [Candidatus Pacearchaeota archaeon]|nr:hypothetical protein [Candidatus Pacearchaeota archaeon]
DPNVFGITPVGEVFKTRGGLTLSAPTDLTWIASTTQNIAWTYKGTTMGNINIYYDPDSTEYSWGTAIDTVSASDGSYSWVVPPTVTNTGAIRIAVQNDLLVEDIGADFRIMAAFDVTAPESGEPVNLADGNYTIYWDTDNGSGIVGVNLYYTNEGDLADPTWIPITTLAGNPGEYSWPPPTGYDDIKSTKHKIRITQQDPLNEDATKLNLLKDGEGFFEIKGDLSFTSPASNQSWGVNTTETITFTKIGDIKSVSIAYSFDGDPTNYDSNILGTVDTSGSGPTYSFDWYIDPSTALTSGFAGKLRLKSVDPTPPIVEKILTPSLEIKGTVELLKPGGTSDVGGPAAEDEIVLSVNGIYQIAWSIFGAINTVEVHYSETGGDAGEGTYPGANLITTKNVIDGTTFNWDVPDAIGTTVRIRVRDANNYNVQDESDYDFRIKGDLTVDLPTATNIIWYVGDTNRTINWTSEGGFSPLDIHFSTNGGTGGGGTYESEDFITAATNCTPGGDNTCTGSVGWAPVPDRIGALVKVRVRGQGTESDVEDESDNNFKILGKLDVISPESASDIWYVGETFRQITWNANGTVTNVKVGYKTAAGGNCTYFAANDGGHGPGSNSYNWTAGVADEKTETAYICLADVNFPAANETLIFSDAAFKIRPRVVVDPALEGMRLKVGTDYPNLIKWTVTGSQTTLVEVRYSLDGGTDGYPVSQQIATNVPVANGVAGIDWDNIPDSVSNDVTLKVFDVNANVVSGESANPLKIVGTVTSVQIRDTSDNQDEAKLKYGQNYLIKWNSTGSTPFDNVSIWYTVHNELGLDTYPLQVIDSTPRATGSYIWNNVPVPLSNDVANQEVIIRVADYNDPLSRGLSPIVKIQSVLDVTKPEDNTIILASGAQDYRIEWNTTGWEAGDEVYVQYQVDGGSWTNCEGNAAQPYPNTSGTNYYEWDIPTTSSVISDAVLARVVDAGDTTNFNESTQLFEIRAGLDVTSPIGNADPAQAEAWLVGSTHKITWTLVGYMNTVKIQVSVDGSEFADISGADGIAATSGATGYTWTIPDSISKEVKIRIVNEADTDVYADSPENFNIIGQIDFNPVLPQGGDSVWYVGETKAIAWTRIGNIPTVKLQYSTDGTSYIDITDAESLTQAESPFIWTVKDIIDPDINIRAINTVVDGTKPTTPAVSGSIEVKGQLTIGSPVLNNLWQVDNTYEVLWTPTGTMTTVKLEYSTDGFASGTEDYPVLGPNDESAADLNAGNDGEQQSFVWGIKNVISKTVTVRVTDNNDSDVYDDSALMKIVGGFKVLTPNGGASQYFEVDRNTPIQWETHGSVTDVLLQYSTNGFLNNDEVTDIITVAAGANGGTYSWDPIPDEIGLDVRIRAIDPDSAYVPSSGTCAPGASETCTISDKSDASFEVRPEVEFLGSNSDSPLGSEIWLIDETHELKWTTHGTINAVKVEYKVGAGGYAYVENPSGTEATSVSENTFVWRIP